MADLFNCFEGNSIASIKIKKNLEKKYGKKIELFYSVPWHSLIQRPQNEVNGEQYIDLYEFYGKEKAYELLEEYGKPNLTEYKVKNLSTNEIKWITPKINTEQWLLTDLNGRFFHNGITRDDCIRFIDFLAKFYIDVIETQRPEFIYDIDTSSVLRDVLYIIAKRYNIKYLALTHSRYKDYVVVTETIGNDIGDELKMLSAHLTDEDILKAIDDLTLLQSKNDILNEEEKKIEESRGQYGLTQYIYSIYCLIRSVISTLLSRDRELHKIGLISSGFKLVVSPSILRGAFYTLLMNTRKYMRSSFSIRNTRSPHHVKDYFYFPLSYLVEGVSSEYSGGLVSDIQILDFIRPYINYKETVIVKEHRAMVPERTSRDVKKISSIPGIYYVGLNAKEDFDITPSTLIRDSIGVICHSGTTGLEAAIFGKPLLIFGAPIYNQFINHKSGSDIKSVRHFFDYPDKYIPDIHATTNYIATIMRFGSQINFSSLFNAVPSENDVDAIASLFLSKQHYPWRLEDAKVKNSF